jgi:hypothetical protein
MSPADHDLLDAARGGDEDAFRRLVEPLDMAARRPPRGLPPDPGPPDGAWLEPVSDDLLGDDAGRAPDAVYEQRKAIELAFVVALQHLPPRQRAALILRDVLGFSAREAGEALDASRSWLMPERAPTGLRYAPARADGQVALGTYAWDAGEGVHLPVALDVLTLRGSRIAALVAFRTPEVFRRFGLPDVLPA